MDETAPRRGGDVVQGARQACLFPGPVVARLAGRKGIHSAQSCLPTYDLTCEGRARAAFSAAAITNCAGLATRSRRASVVLCRPPAGRGGCCLRAGPPSHSMILTTHTGSLPRPADVSEAMLQYDAGQLADVDVLRDRVASATVEVV